MDESGPQSHVLIEVDDLATHGNAVHAENIAKFQKTFKFGKWKSIYNSEGDYASRTIIQDQSYSFHIHQAKFVRERFAPIVISKGSAAQTRNRRQVIAKKDNCERCGVLSIGSSGRPAQKCQPWHHLAWDLLTIAQCKSCGAPMQQWSG